MLNLYNILLLKKAALIAAIFLLPNYMFSQINLFQENEIYKNKYIYSEIYSDGIYFLDGEFRYKIKPEFSNNSFSIEKSFGEKREFLRLENQEFIRLSIKNSIFVLSGRQDSIIINIINSDFEFINSKVIFYQEKVYKFLPISDNIFLINDKLFDLRGEVKVIDANVLDAKYSNPYSNTNLLYINTDNSSTNIFVYNKQRIQIGKTKYYPKAKFLLNNENDLYLEDDFTIEYLRINNNFKVLYNTKVKANTLNYSINEKIYSLINDNGAYQLEITNTFDRKTTSTITLPDNLYNPQKIELFKDDIYIIFQNGFVAINENEIIGLNYSGTEDLSEIIQINKEKNKLNIITNKNLIVYKIEPNSFYLLKNIIQTKIIYLASFIFILLIFIIVRFYRQQQRVLQTFIDLPSTGMVLLLNSSGDLLRLNSYARKIIDLNENVPLKKYIIYYLGKNGLGELNHLIEKAIKIKDNFNQKINIFSNNKNKEFLCSVNFLYSFSGKAKGILVTAVDITEELERKRISNWAQLAHDMQTNLSTIKLNAEQLDLEVKSLNAGRKKKIVHQVNLLIQKVRDIVTVGRSSRISSDNYSAKELIDEVYHEFESLPETNIVIEKKCTDFQIKCDKQKMVRGIRNAVENAVKAMKKIKYGKIILKSDYDHRNHYFRVIDNGPGMDEETKHLMLTPYFTTNDNNDGSGIGTMIMQNVIEQHGGKLIIKSEKGKGTEVIFKIPIQRN